MAHVNLTGRILSVCVVAVSALALRGPARLDAQSATFKSGVDMVPLTVTVTDPTGKYVTGLTGDDFTVFEDGVAQPLSFFACDDVPVDVALVLDTSSSMGPDLPLVQSAASGLVGRLRASDRGAVVDVKDSARIPQPFTSDRALIERAIRGLSASGATALYDGIYVVLREFERERRGTLQVRRQVLVLLSDGLDTTSHVAFEDVMDLARRAGVNIYVIALRGGVAWTPRKELDEAILRADYSMKAVARDSGGRSFFPTVRSASSRRSTRRSRRSWPASTNWDTCRRGPAATARSDVSWSAFPHTRMRSRGREADTTPRARRGKSSGAAMRARRLCGRLTVLLVTAACTGALTGDAWAQARETITIRGQDAIAARVRHPRRYPGHRLERGWRLDSSGAACRGGPRRQGLLRRRLRRQGVPRGLHVRQDHAPPGGRARRLQSDRRLRGTRDEPQADPDRRV